MCARKWTSCNNTPCTRAHVACTCLSTARPIARHIHVHTGKCCVQHFLVHARVACVSMLSATTHVACICCLEHVHMLRTTTKISCTCCLEKNSNPIHLADALLLQGVFYPNKISGVGTNFGLLVHVFPEPNKRFVWTYIFSWFRGRKNYPGRLVRSTYSSFKFIFLWFAVPMWPDRKSETHAGKV
jgi:hypothetical protein